MEPIHLDRNENRYGPAPACREALRAIAPEALFAYPRDFQRGHYSALGERLAARHGVDERRIVLGYGAEDLLKQALQHVVRPGERVLIPSASWWYYRTLVDEIDGVTIEYPIVEGPTSYAYDLDALHALHAQLRARVLLLATPNNPTGNALPRAQLRPVLERFRDAVVVLDEAYLGFEDEPIEDTAPLVEEFPNLLVLRTFSKRYALAGARIGYAVAGRGLDAFVRASARTLGFHRVSEKLALAALDDEAWYAEITSRMVRDRRRLIDALRAFEGVRAYDSQANFVLARFPAAIVAGLRDALARRGYVPKFFTEPAFASCARITIGTEPEQAGLVEAFRQILPAMLARAEEKVA